MASALWRARPCLISTYLKYFKTSLLSNLDICYKSFQQIYNPYKLKLMWQPRHFTLCDILSGQTLLSCSKVILCSRANNIWFHAWPIKCRLSSKQVVIVIFHRSSLPCVSKQSFSLILLQNSPPSLPFWSSVACDTQYCYSWSPFILIPLSSTIFI